jgi:hypothetical protein
VKCSIVDLAITAPTGTEGEALEASLVTARQAAVLGFHRIWFAEHHLTRGVASHHPEILMSAVAALTTGIRIGSGGVLVNHYSPLKIAEMFKQMEALFPGRIDLGMGRATSGPLIDAALNREPPSRRVDDYEQRLLETLAWLHAAFPDTHSVSDTAERAQPAGDLAAGFEPPQCADCRGIRHRIHLRGVPQPDAGGTVSAVLPQTVSIGRIREPDTAHHVECQCLGRRGRGRRPQTGLVGQGAVRPGRSRRLHRAGSSTGGGEPRDVVVTARGTDFDRRRAVAKVRCW